METQNWAIEAIKKTDISKSLIILENPELRNHLDSIINKIWPSLKSHLEKTGYTFSPNSDPLIETKLSNVLVRSMMIMLFDAQSAFCRINLDCSPDHWMIRNKFFLTLPASADLKFICEILGNSRLSGNPPSLVISKNKPAAYYQITFDTGRGEGWGMHDTSYLIGKLKRSVDVNISMFEIMLDGEVNENIVAEFLTAAYEIYEAY